MINNSLKDFISFGLDTNSAPEIVSKEDVIDAYNVRGTGTSEGEAGYVTNIESTELVNEPTAVPAGIIKGIGGREFDDIKKAITFRYNSFGNHQILVYDYQANDFRAIYTDKTDSGGVSLMPLDPQFYVTSILLVNEKYLVWTDGQSSIGFTNLNKLISGAYGTILAEDFSLIKPQPMAPITGYYSNDPGKASNFLKNKLFQFNTMWFGEEYTSSAWSTWSKRIIPQEESTPDVGDDSTKNNCIILSVPVGSPRVLTINIGARYGDFDFNIIKTVDRAYAISLPNTAINISTEILEAYDPSTGLYSFVFYNDSVAIPVAPTETDLAYDFVPLTAGAATVLNSDIIALGDLKEGYEKPNTSVTISATGYDPNLTVPSADSPTQFAINDFYAGASGSGAGNHRRKMHVDFVGVPEENDQIFVVLADIRDASATQTYTYTVPSSQDGDLDAVVQSFGQVLVGSNIEYLSGGAIRINFIGDPYFGGQRAYIILSVTGPSVSKSIHSVLDNSSYQLALSYRDGYGRYFPLLANNSFIVNTPSFAQVQGLAIKLNWNINNAIAPANAVDYQWLITKNNTTLKILDVLGSVIDYNGVWNAHTNSPALQATVGDIGETYQIGAPPQPGDSTVNLGSGTDYKTGDYIVFNGLSWDIVSKDFADMTTSGDCLVFKINPLNLFNSSFSSSVTGTVLNYEFSENDRCTLHFYYSSPTTKVWLNNPCIELGVIGYDPTTFLVKVSKPSTLDPATLAGKNVYLRLSSPKQQTPTDTQSSAQTVWYEIGERFTITNGNHDVLSGSITDGDVYFKTRQYRGAVDPENAYPYLATDFNFSDYYESAFTSYGRPRSLYDVLEQTERKAIIRYSQNFILGSRNNGLTRFFAEAIYGEADGETSSAWGAIGVLWQRGNRLIIIQENNQGSAGINRSILEDMAQQRQYAISEKLINNIDYNQTGNIGIGRAKESFCFYDNMGWFIDPSRSVPMQIGLDGLTDISFKMNKFFKQTIQEAYSAGKKLVMYYDRYYKEVVFATETDGGTLTQFTFSALSWKVIEDYTVTPGSISAANGAHSTVSYNTGTGIGTYTPTTDYVGNDVAVISFSVDGNPVTKNVCLNWTAGSDAVNAFNFNNLTDQPQSTLLYSNSVLISGNNIPSPISISAGGEYAINGGAFTSVSGTVLPDSLVQVRQTSSGSYDTTTTITLTVDGQSSPFSVTTIEEPPVGSVVLQAQVTQIELGMETGNILFRFKITSAVTDALTVNYQIEYVQGGITQNPSSPPTAVIPAGNTANTVLAQPFSMADGTVTSVTFTIISVVPNPSGGQTITYTSPQTIAV